MELNGWSKKFEDPDLMGDARFNIYNAIGTLTLYPSNGGLFVKGGAGVAMTDLDLDLDLDGFDATIEMRRGLALVAGVGYDVPVGRIAITPTVNYWYGSTGDLTFMRTSILSGVHHNAVTATIGVKFP